MARERHERLRAAAEQIKRSQEMRTTDDHDAAFVLGIKQAVATHKAAFEQVEAAMQEVLVLSLRFIDSLPDGYVADTGDVELLLVCRFFAERAMDVASTLSALVKTTEMLDDQGDIDPAKLMAYADQEAAKQRPT